MEEERIDFLKASDFQYIQDFLNNILQEFTHIAASETNPEKLLTTARRACYFQHFVDDMAVFGYPRMTKILEEKFKTAFGSEHIFADVLTSCVQKALPQLSGLHQIGENQYVIRDGKAYYRNCKGTWYHMAEKEIFYLLPKLDEKAPEKLIEELERVYVPSLTHRVFNAWHNNTYLEKVPEDYIRVETLDTTPDEYFDRSVLQIKKVLHAPVSIEAVEMLHTEGENYLESLIKVSLCLIEVVKRLRNDTTLNLYLLRDGMMLAEMQKTLDLITHTDTLSSQIMVGRKLMSSKDKPEFFWGLIVDVLYAALRKHPDDTVAFQKAYNDEMAQQLVHYPELGSLVARLESYIGRHVEEAISTGKDVRVVDTGFQGSVTMLTKFIVDSISLSRGVKTSTDTYLCVTSEWFLGIYQGKYWSDYYPFMRDIEFFNRSEYVYSYKKGSFDAGDVIVEMGPQDKQILSNIELIVSVITCKLAEEEGLL